MNLDSDRGVDALRTELFVLPSSATAYFSVEAGGFPETGGASTARQEGDQYTLRCRRTDYLTPTVHDKLTSTVYGVLEVKQIFTEGNLWAIRATGKVKGRREL